MANKVLFIFEAVDKYTKIGKKIAKVTQHLTDKVKKATKGTEKFSREIVVSKNQLVRMSSSYSGSASRIVNANRSVVASFKKVNNVVDKTKKKFKKLNRVVLDAGRSIASAGAELTAKLTLPIMALGTVSVMNAVKMQQLRVAFDTLLRSGVKGKKLFEEMRTFAATTPFKLNEVMEASKMLLSYNVEAKDMNKTMRMLGDIAAASGKPLKEFALVFGQIKGKAKLLSEEANQLAEKGIGIFQELAEATGRSVPALRKMAEQGKISFNDVAFILKRMTGEQGRFFELTLKQSKTLGGAWAKLQGQFQETTTELGLFLIKELKLNEVVNNLTNSMKRFTESFKTFTKEHPTIAKILLVFIGILAVLGPIILVVGQMVIAVGAITIAFSLFGTAVWVALAPILLVIAAVTLVAIAAFMIWNNWREMLGGLKALIIDFGKLIIKVLLFPLKGYILLFNVIWGKIQSMRAGIKNFFSDAKEESISFGGQLDVVGTSKTQVDINLKDPGGMVESTKQTTKTPGNQTPFNIGVYNMVGM